MGLFMNYSAAQSKQNQKLITGSLQDRKNSFLKENNLLALNELTPKVRIPKEAFDPLPAYLQEYAKKNDRSKEKLKRDEDNQKISNSAIRLSLNETGTIVDFEVESRIIDYLNFGVSAYTDFQDLFRGYLFLSLYAPISLGSEPKSNFRIVPWINGGYDAAFVSNGTKGSFAYELGFDLFFTRTFGVTLYAPKLETYYAGLAFRL